jgi:hypothetical protein
MTRKHFWLVVARLIGICFQLFTNHKYFPKVIGNRRVTDQSVPGA